MAERDQRRPLAAPSQSLDAWRANSQLAGGGAWLEQLYEHYLNEPKGSGEDWQRYFAGLPPVDGAAAGAPEPSHSALRREFARRPGHAVAAAPAAAVAAPLNSQLQARLDHLVEAYHRIGHRCADLDPLGLAPQTPLRELTPGHYGIGAEDLAVECEAGGLCGARQRAPLANIIAALERNWCGSIGVQFMHMPDDAARHWVIDRMESSAQSHSLDDSERRHLFTRLTAAEQLEQYLGLRYQGMKRFGLEGAESMLPMVEEIIQRAGQAGVLEVIIGMPHRGRLNLLVNTMGKRPGDLFEEFEGRSEDIFDSGDVKYHKGFSSNVRTGDRELHMALAFNPSHLEIVMPVVQGSVRARQDRRRDTHGQLVLPIVMHGDAAFAGQGVVMESLQMSGTRAFRVGGTVHLVLNNQIGFTISNPRDARSTAYATDVAKMLGVPVFHVNGDDPQAAVAVARMALDYRMRFGCDVVIDLVCYRRRGHNEADDPFLTQPMMYRRIDELPTVRQRYAAELERCGLLREGEAERLAQGYRRQLERGDHVAEGLVREPDRRLFVDWAPYLNRHWDDFCNTAVPAGRLRALAEELSRLPDGFEPRRSVTKLFDGRRRMSEGELPLNWGFAENLAYATLIEEGHSVRLVGQDVRRGTFSHRHAVLHDQRTGDEYEQLAEFARERANGAKFQVYDSLLSELAVLGFEYGYAATSPSTLVIWEAQFGDFANGAQMIIDQFISSGEYKWGRLCGLTMLLPHGYEGQGPEHSSARLERYLQLCAENNMQVCAPTTPAQIFHLLRRQILRPLRKPLIVMSPKSLLRHSEAVSSLEEFQDGGFQPVLADPDAPPCGDVRRLVLCSGKVYYELHAQCQESGRRDLLLLRLEQLYPFPRAALDTALRPYRRNPLERIIWCQEEPRNQGAWRSGMRAPIERLLRNQLGIELELEYVGRENAAATAAGYAGEHRVQQQQLVREAVGA